MGDPQRPGPAERTRAGGVQTRETQRGALVRTVGVLQIALFVVAGLDAGRYGWSTVPMPVQVIGWLLLVPAVWLVSWALMSNTYASVELRIQAERGHLVIATGPYAYVRHPMYLGAILGGTSIPLLLGLWWAFTQGFALAALFALRTAHEDRVLQDELPGYTKYAGKVMHRLVPGTW